MSVIIMNDNTVEIINSLYEACNIIGDKLGNSFVENLMDFIPDQEEIDELNDGLENVQEYNEELEEEINNLKTENEKLNCVLNGESKVITCLDINKMLDMLGNIRKTKTNSDIINELSIYIRNIIK